MVLASVLAILLRTSGHQSLKSSSSLGFLSATSSTMPGSCARKAYHCWPFPMSLDTKYWSGPRNTCPGTRALSASKPPAYYNAGTYLISNGIYIWWRVLSNRRVAGVPREAWLVSFALHLLPDLGANAVGPYQHIPFDSATICKPCNYATICLVFISYNLGSWTSSSTENSIREKRACASAKPGARLPLRGWQLPGTRHSSLSRSRNMSTSR
eukprot:scaffold1195_cov358-Prasinococcus_capsulatus_cf.AAC.4